MPDIQMEAATGRSTKNLMEAIANAFNQAMQGRSHNYSVTLMIDGYEFDGKEYKVNIRVMMFDLDDDKRELYEYTAREHEKQEELADAMAAAFYHRAIFGNHDNVAEYIQHMIEEAGDTSPDEMRVIATPEMHERLERETGFIPRYEYTPAMHKTHTDLPEPALGPGRGNSDGEGKGSRVA